ncbi:MAG: 50S ribosomal protein L29 [Desulfobulbaceae bacterium]|uniref:Large ribosomal subunit protein uL29 n=1 Tax=Candidatus Desulfatifera sulfidica TaxID=2841691 RepID=A0A8J6N9F1_9BACT|nr:50S ribosomal protein L29 [Candidatus Desulfatifera sulfidica]
MKYSELVKMSAEELVKKEKDLREELGKITFQHKIRPLENTALIGLLRKDIARICTLRNQKSEQ